MLDVQRESKEHVSRSMYAATLTASSSGFTLGGHWARNHANHEASKPIPIGAHPPKKVTQRLRKTAYGLLYMLLGTRYGRFSTDPHTGITPQQPKQQDSFRKGILASLAVRV